MTEATLPITVVIATYNRSTSLLRTLRSFLPQTLPTELWELVVVNNNSTDDTAQQVEAFAAEHPSLPLRLLFEGRQGVSYACNAGFEAGQGENFVIVDDDEEVNPEFVEAYHAFFAAYPDAAACGGRITPLYEYTPPRWLSPYTERPIAGTLELGTKVIPFPLHKYPGGGNMGVRRSALERYGLFDTGLGRSGVNPLGGEEKELIFRLRAAGEKIYYVPDAVIWHIIPEARFEDSYFDRLNYLCGVSERYRTRSKGCLSFARRLFMEGVKWGGTLVLALGYTLRGEATKGCYLIRLRRQISRGLLDSSNDVTK